MKAKIKCTSSMLNGKIFYIIYEDKEEGHPFYKLDCEQYGMLWFSDSEVELINES